MRVRNLAVIFGSVLFFALLAAAGMRPRAQERGEKPSAAEVVRKAIEEKGLVTAKEEFARILQERNRYVFEENEFLALGNEYLKAGKPHLAAAVFDVAAEAFPGSVSVLRLLAHSHYLAGDEERSLKVQAKMMSVRGKAELAGFLEKNKNSLAKTAEDVIARSLEATGGRKAWEAIKTMVVVFSIQTTAGEQTRMVRMYKRPSLYRQGLEGSPDFVATDGTTCWSVSGGEWKKEASNFYLPLVSMDNWLLDYEAAGIRYEFMGFDYFNGSPVYHLRRTFRDGYVEDLFFSALSNLLTEVRSDYVQRQPFMKSFKSLWNYREVSGVKIPFIFMRNMGSLEPPHGGIYEDVRVNVPLDDKLFLPPDFKK
jgi:hypothetical protein